MVQLMLAGFGGDRRKRRKPAETVAVPPAAQVHDIECYHVNARLSNKLEDIGNLRIGKSVLLLGYCIQAVWCRFRYGITTFYYVPAPGKRSAVYRDWMVMLVCRAFFKRLVLHWHAAGLATWLETVANIRWRTLTYHLIRPVDLSIVLSRFNRADAEKLFSQEIKVVGNGIPDPCPEFVTEVLPPRKARFAARKKLLSGHTLTEDDLKGTGGSPQVVRVLYLAHCTREKGLFDALAGVVLASQRLAERRFPVCLRLLVAGTFVTTEERAEFDRLAAQPGAADIVQYYGFVSGAQKNKLLREADLFCFPTYYENENQPVNLIEAMAFGLPILTTRWRSLPELFPANYPGLVDIRSPEQIANVMPALMTGEAGDGFREIFIRNFTLERHLAGLADAFQKLEQPQPDAMPAAAVGTLPG
jgi:glycosyltransferase involved in cell wall biosynthesis